jgi:hypothetical protein
MIQLLVIDVLSLKDSENNRKNEWLTKLASHFFPQLYTIPNTMGSS